jgi:hypothetical protein
MLIAFSEEDLRRAEHMKMVQNQLHALKHERPPREEWARNCVAEFEKKFATTIS